MLIASIRIALLVSLFLLGGCGRYNYKQPTPDHPHATLRVISDQSGMMSVQMFSSFPDATCTSPGYVMAAFNWAREKEQELLVRPDEKMHILATFQRVSGSRAVGDTTEIQSNYCNNVVSFTPESNHSYQLSQSPVDNQCRVKLIDTASMTAPPTFEVHEVRGNCTHGVY